MLGRGSVERPTGATPPAKLPSASCTRAVSGCHRTTRKRSGGRAVRPSKATPARRTTSPSCTRAAAACVRTTRKPSAGIAARQSRDTPSRRTTSASVAATALALSRTTGKRFGGSAVLPGRGMPAARTTSAGCTRPAAACGGTAWKLSVGTAWRPSRGTNWQRAQSDPRLWETAVLFHLRDAFRAGDVWLARSPGRRLPSRTGPRPWSPTSTGGCPTRGSPTILLEVDDATRFTEDLHAPADRVALPRPHRSAQRAARRGNQPRPAQDGRGHDHARVLGVDAHRPMARGRRRVRPSPGHRRRGPGRATDGRLLGHGDAPPPATANSPPPEAGAKPSTWSTPGTGRNPASRRTPTSPTGSPRSPPRPSRPPSTRPPTSSTGS